MQALTSRSNTPATPVETTTSSLQRDGSNVSENVVHGFDFTQSIFMRSPSQPLPFAEDLQLLENTIKNPLSAIPYESIILACHKDSHNVYEISQSFLDSYPTMGKFSHFKVNLGKFSMLGKGILATRSMEMEDGSEQAFIIVVDPVTLFRDIFTDTFISEFLEESLAPKECQSLVTEPFARPYLSYTFERRSGPLCGDRIVLTLGMYTNAVPDIFLAYLPRANNTTTPTPSPSTHSPKPLFHTLKYSQGPDDALFVYAEPPLPKDPQQCPTLLDDHTAVARELQTVCADLFKTEAHQLTCAFTLSSWTLFWCIIPPQIKEGPNILAQQLLKHISEDLNPYVWAGRADAETTRQFQDKTTGQDNESIHK